MPPLRTPVLIPALAAALFWIGPALPETAAAAPAGATSPPKGVVAMLPIAKRSLKKGKIGTARISGKQAVLAAWKEGTKLVRLVNVRDGRSKTKGFEVKLVGNPNGANTRYEIVRPDGWRVLAILTNVRKDLKERRSMPVVYVPYGGHIDTPEFRKAGREYLEKLVKGAGGALDRLGVASRTDPAARITEVVPWKVLLTLLVIEHIDPDDFKARGAEATAHRVLALVGANQGDAYDYAVSERKAGGLAQFIPATYAEVRKKYPEARLIADFMKGMRDHRNAVMIQYCFIDHALTKPAAADLKRLMKDDEELGAYLAAAYNHGQNGAAKALAAHGDDWDKSGNGIPDGSLLYVKEFRAVYRLLWEE